MNKSILISALIAVLAAQCASAKEESRVTYVGQGRYTCEGDSYKCARIQQENNRESDRRRQEYQRDQDRAQDYVDRARQREDEARRTYR